MSNRTVRRVAAITAALFSTLSLASTVAMLVFAYIAALRPGGPDPELDAAVVSFISAIIFGALSAGSVVLLAEETR